MPPALRRRLDDDPWMHKCCYCGARGSIEWNHALIYKNCQINEWYAIIPLCSECHRGYNGTIKKEIRDYCTWLALIRGLQYLQRDYPRHDWAQDKRYLDRIFLKNYERN